jgi:hypothetical protein
VAGEVPAGHAFGKSCPKVIGVGMTEPSQEVCTVLAIEETTCCGGREICLPRRAEGTPEALLICAVRMDRIDPAGLKNIDAASWFRTATLGRNSQERVSNGGGEHAFKDAHCSRLRWLPPLCVDKFSV